MFYLLLLFFNIYTYKRREKSIWDIKICKYQYMYKGPDSKQKYGLLTLLCLTVSICFFGKYKSASRAKLWGSRNRERIRKNKNASCMIYRRYTYTDDLASSSRSLPLPRMQPSSSSRSRLFLAQQPFPQLLLPTFEVTSRPFRPSVTS